MCSSQPRLTPRRSFSSGQIQFWTTPGDLVAGPGHDPQVGVELGPVVRLGVGVLGHLAMAPVVAEGLVLGLDDRPPIGPRRRAGARSRRAAAPRGRRRGPAGASGRSGGPARSPSVPAGRADRPTRPRRTPPARRARPGPRARRAPGRGRWSRPSAHVPRPRRRSVRVDRAPDLVLAGLADGALDAGRGDGPAVDLDQHDVVDRIARRPRSPSRPGAFRRSAGTGSRRARLAAPSSSARRA